jgi:hypothetical protein
LLKKESGSGQVLLIQIQESKNIRILSCGSGSGTLCGIYFSVYFQLDYEESAMPKESVEAMDDYPEAEAAGQHEDVEAKEENNEDENSFLPVGLAIFFILGQLIVGMGGRQLIWGGNFIDSLEGITLFQKGGGFS